MRAFALVAAVVALAVSAQLTVPMIPVPMTMQSFAVLVVAALGGWAYGFRAVVLYLVLGAAGLPVLADGTGGVARFTGPTGGFLFGFALVAAGIALAVARGWTRSTLGLTAVLASAHALLFVAGVAGLARVIGLDAAIAKGLEPFVLGAVVKTALAITVVAAVERATDDAPRSDDPGPGPA